ncbi:hypothetical protein ACXHXM_34045
MNSNIDIKTLSRSALRVLEHAVSQFKAYGHIDTVTAMDLTLEGIDPDDALDFAEAYTERTA